MAASVRVMADAQERSPAASAKQRLHLLRCAGMCCCLAARCAICLKEETFIRADTESVGSRWCIEKYGAHFPKGEDLAS
jgi:hypothetical protein